MKQKTKRLSAVFVLIAVAVYAAMACLPARAEATPDRWEWLVPTPQGNQIVDMWAASATEVFIVGDGGMIMFYNGTSYEVMYSGTVETLRGVWGFSATDVYAVGYSGSLLHYDGTGWAVIASQPTVGFMSVWGTSGTDLFISSGNGSVYHYDGSSLSGTFLQGDFLRGVWGFSSSDVYVAGVAGKVYHYDGATWSATTAPTTETMTSVWGFTSTDVYSTDAAGGLFLYNGTSWSPITLGYAFTPYSIRGLSANNIFITGSSGTFLYTTDGFGSVTKAPQATSNTLYGIAPISSSSVHVGGGDGFLYQFNGTNLINQRAEPGTFSAHGMHETSPGQFIIAGELGYMRTYDGSTFTTTKISSSHYYDLFALDAAHAYAAGSAGGIAVYNGTNWTPYSSAETGAPATAYFFGAWAASPTEVFFAGYDPSNSGKGVILHFDGSAFTVTNNLGWGLKGIWGTAANDVYAAGSTGGGFFHFDGSTWSDTGAPSIPNVTRLWGLSATEIYAATQNPPRVYRYDGSAWTVAASGTGDYVALKDDLWLYREVLASGVSIRLMYFDGAFWSPLSMPFGTPTSPETAARYTDGTGRILVAGYRRLVRYQPAYVLSSLSGNTTEAGGTATFTVKLPEAPTGDVTLSITSSNTNEATVSPASLTFTSANWNSPQTVTVTGADDFSIDGDTPFQVTVAVSASASPDYLTTASSLTVGGYNADDDTPGFTLSAVSGAANEAGTSATFTAVLDTSITGTVVLTVASQDLTEGTVSPSTLTFTSANWNAPQTVTVTGVDDFVDDGNQPFNVSVSINAGSTTEAGYPSVSPQTVSVTNNDNDTAGVTVSSMTGTPTEAGGSGTFTVKLNSEPSANVTVGVSSSDTAEATVSPASLTFTSVNWASPQTVTVTGVDDDLDDGNQSVTAVTAAATSTDGGYSGMAVADVLTSNTDNDTAGFTVSKSTVATAESGATDTFTVVLNSEPTADVTVGVSSSDTTEGTVSPASLTFTSLNWNAPQAVTVSGANDFVADGNQVYTVVLAAATSADSGYSGMNPADLTGTNTDNDSPGVSVGAISGNTTEAGGTATFTVVLNSEPTADVTVPVSSLDTSEGTVSSGSLTFTSADWSTPQAVTVTGVDDSLADSDQPYTVVLGVVTSADGGYSGLNPADVSTTNTDNDTPGITVSAISANTTEAGGTATFTVVLNSEPTADVTVPVSSSNTLEGTVSTVSLTFTSADWNTPQTVTVTGVDDYTPDGDQAYAVVLGAASSADTGYDGMAKPDVSLSNVDNENGNHPPTPSSLIAPSDGATNVDGANAVFKWTKFTDADGDTVTYDLYVCDDMTFASCATPVNGGTPIASALTKGALYAGGSMGAFVLAGLVLGGGVSRRRRAFALILAVALMAAVALTACGGGGSSSSAPVNQVSYKVTSLSAGTQYYWKVVGTDGMQSRETTVFTFTTK